MENHRVVFVPYSPQMEKTRKESFVAVGQETDPITRPVKYRRTILESNARLWMTCVLVASDMLGLFIAILVALQVRHLPGITLDSYYQEIFVLLAIILVIAFGRKGLYPAIGLNYVDELREIVSSSSFTFLILIGMTFIIKTTSIYSRLALLLIWALCQVTIPTGRYAVRRLLIRLHLWGEPVAIIGDPSKDSALAEYFRINLQLGLRPVAVFRDEYFSEGMFGPGPLMSIDQIRDNARNMSLRYRPSGNHRSQQPGLTGEPLPVCVPVRDPDQRPEWQLYVEQPQIAGFIGHTGAAGRE